MKKHLFLLYTFVGKKPRGYCKNEKIVEKQTKRVAL
jgi:hypothetical protein